MALKCLIIQFDFISTCWRHQTGGEWEWNNISDLLPCLSTSACPGPCIYRPFSQLLIVQRSTAVSVRTWGPPAAAAQQQDDKVCIAEHPANPSPHGSSSAQTSCRFKEPKCSVLLEQSSEGLTQNKTNPDGSLFDVCAVSQHIFSRWKKLSPDSLKCMNFFTLILYHLSLSLSFPVFSLKSHFSMCFEYVCKAKWVPRRAVVKDEMS